MTKNSKILQKTQISRQKIPKMHANLTFTHNRLSKPLSQITQPLNLSEFQPKFHPSYSALPELPLKPLRAHKSQDFTNEDKNKRIVYQTTHKYSVVEPIFMTEQKEEERPKQPGPLMPIDTHKYIDVIL